MEDNKFHLKIPKENVRNEEYAKTGGGESVPRANHSEHGKKLLAVSKEMIAAQVATKDNQFTDKIFLQVETPNDYSLKSQKFKIKNLGFEIVDYSKFNNSIGTARISKENYKIFETKLEEYIATEDNVGKTYFAPIENITNVPIENKIDVDIDYTSKEPVSIVINLYNILSKKEKFSISKTMIDELTKKAENVNHYDFANGVSSIECTIPANEIPEFVQEYSTIKIIEENKIFVVEASTPAESMPNPMTVEDVESDSVICVVDSGIASANGIFDKLIVDKYPLLPTGSVDATYDHGTFVASRCVFGDSIDNCLGSHSLKPYCNIVDAQVFGINKDGNAINPSEMHLRYATQVLCTRSA